MNKYTEELKSILKLSELESMYLGSKFVGTEHIVLSILKTENSLYNTLKKYNLTYKLFLKEINKEKVKEESLIFYSLELKKALETTILLSKENNEEELNITSLFLTILEDNTSNATKILKKLDINISSLYKDISKLYISNNLLLTDIGIDITELAKNKELDKIIGRDKEIERIIEILARKNKNNPILLGEAGVGKTAIVEELANRIANNHVPNFLKNKKIISLNLASVISGTKYRGEFEEKMSKIIKELEDNEELILFIDEIHTLVGAGGAEGAIDASNIIKPVLARGKVKCIGATTLNEYKKTIEKDKALDRRFQKVIIDEPNKKETIYILSKIKKDYEKYHNVIIPSNIINLIVELSNKYILDRNEPDKSIDLLDEVCAKTSIFSSYEQTNKLIKNLNKIKKEKTKHLLNKNYEKAIVLKNQEKELNKLLIEVELNNKVIVTKDKIKEVLENKLGNKIIELNENNNIYEEIRKNMQKQIVGQNKAINELIEITKSLKYINKPIAILIEGTKGNGKTFLAKTYSEALNKNLITINLNEYNNELSINKILGSPQGYIGYNDTNTTFEKIKTKPNSLILLENIENAHPKVINLILSIIESSELNLSNGETIKFKNNIFIFTTNNSKNVNVGFINNFSSIIEKDNFYKEKINYIIKLNTLKTLELKAIIAKQIKDEELINKIINELNYNQNGLTNLSSLIIKHLKTNVYN